MTQKKQLTQNKLYSTLGAFYRFFQETEDAGRLEKVQNYYRKAEHGDLSIVFCGHFSAGKSSLLNALSEDGTLPVSPVPTSANVVVLRKGPSRAVAHLFDGTYAEFSPPFDIKDIKRLCKNGELVKEIEIFTPYFGLDGIALYDTPGIDSTDEEHYKSADAVSDAADVIFYVMDYNHVLSETNFHFIDKLTKKGVTVKLVINQMDKHSESELSLEDFKKKAEENFSKYGITREDMFFTSVHSPGLAGNGLNALRAYIEKASLEKENILKREWQRRLIWLASDYIEENKPDEQDESVLQDALRDVEGLKERVLNSEQKADEEKKKWRHKLQSILNDAILMPYETREKAASVLESLQPKFKVGFFGSRDKTAKEREERLSTFSQSLDHNVQTQIIWHVKRVMDEFTKVYGAQMDLSASGVTHKMLTSAVRPGMDADGKALLHYCDQIAGEVRSMIRRDLIPVLSLMDEAIEHTSSRQNGEQLLQLKQREAELNVMRERAEALTVWREKKRLLEDITSGTIGSEQEIQQLANSAAGTKIDVLELLQQTPIIAKKAKKEEQKAVKNQSVLQKEITTLVHNINVLSGFPAFAEDASDARDLVNRIENRRYTFALFGAFSSGKSSFANALIGEKVLPTSPNPMTAAIYEIKKPDNDHPHRTALIECKSEDEMLAEMHDEHAAFRGETLNEAVEWISSANTEQHRLLQSVLEGYSVMKDKAGQSFSASMDEIEKYGAYEPYACYVKKITVYYSCELTERGIVLVDTPGADSIHSRHTDVAFQYIKNSDVILYVTYYNHAFSSADKEFLIQLGRVKDVFLADKMFFILNACDLAQDEEEIELVASHINDNLHSFGIRHPRLYPVSSHAELQENKNSSSFHGLRQDLDMFMETELSSVMAAQCESKNTYLKERLSGIVRDLMRSEQEKETRSHELLSEAEKLKQTAVRQFAVPEEKLFLEITELIHYVKQRVTVRSHDFFKECYHPGIMNSGSSSSDALTIAALELWNKIEYDLNQELKATSLRIEKWISSFLTEAEQNFRRLENKLLTLDALDVSRFDYTTPVMHHKLLLPEEKEIKTWNKQYKNARQFFEGSGRDELKEKLFETLSVILSKWIDQTLVELRNHYAAECEDKHSAAIQHFYAQISRAAGALLQALENPNQAEQYEKALLKLHE